MSRVLVVDDEPSIVRTLSISLRARGYDVIEAGDGSGALAAVKEQAPDVVVLDLALPDMDGTQVIAEVREWSRVPILVLSGRIDISRQVEALDLGADAYVCKPFVLDELVARLRALIRRACLEKGGLMHEVVHFGLVTVDLTARRIDLAGSEVRLTRTEWHLLEVLVRNPGRLVSQQELLADVWGPGYESARGNLRLYMAQLRRKVEPDPAVPTYFRNERGLGYRFDPSGAPPQ